MKDKTTSKYQSETRKKQLKTAVMTKQQLKTEKLQRKQNRKIKDSISQEEPEKVVKIPKRQTSLEKRQEVVQLKVEGYTVSQIAQITGLNVKTVASIHEADRKDNYREAKQESLKLLIQVFQDQQLRGRLDNLMKEDDKNETNKKSLSQIRKDLKLILKDHPEIGIGKNRKEQRRIKNRVALTFLRWYKDSAIPNCYYGTQDQFYQGFQPQYDSSQFSNNSPIVTGGTNEMEQEEEDIEYSTIQFGQRRTSQQYSE